MQNSASKTIVVLQKYFILIGEFYSCICWFQEDDGDEIGNPDLNGNIRLHADDSDEKDDDDKLSDSSDLPEGWQRHEGIIPVLLPDTSNISNNY